MSCTWATGCRPAPNSVFRFCLGSPSSLVSDSLVHLPPGGLPRYDQLPWHAKPQELDHRLFDHSSAMPLPRSPVTPSTQNSPIRDSTGYATTTSFTSPSPRSKVSNWEFVSPGTGSNYHHYQQAQELTASIATAAAPVLAAVVPPPQARVTGDQIKREAYSTFRDPFNDTIPPTAPSNTADPVKELEPPRTSGHSRSSSSGALSDSLRNLNRWSASTASSRTSNLTSLTKRISVEVFGGTAGSPSRKLHKSRPSTSSISPRQTVPARIRAESPTPAVPPLQTLPQISIGPSLEEEVRQSNVLDRASPLPRPRFLIRPSDDPGLYWDGAPRIPEDNSGPSSQLEPAQSLLPAAAITPERTMPYTQNGDSRGHSRTRSAHASADTTASSRSRDRDRDRANRPPSQRTMLSKALQKANTAVQLDNAQNTEGARSAYSEACRLLQQVLERTSAEEDRKKLEAIVSCPRCHIRASRAVETMKGSNILTTVFAVQSLHGPHFGPRGVNRGRRAKRQRASTPARKQRFRRLGASTIW